MRCVVLFLSLLLLTFEANAISIYQCFWEHSVYWNISKDCLDKNGVCKPPNVSSAETTTSGETAEVRWGMKVALMKEYAETTFYKVDSSGWVEQKDTVGNGAYYKRIKTDGLFNPRNDYGLDTDDDIRRHENVLRLHWFDNREEGLRIFLQNVIRRSELVLTDQSLWLCEKEK